MTVYTKRPPFVESWLCPVWWAAIFALTAWYVGQCLSNFSSKPKSPQISREASSMRRDASLITSPTLLHQADDGEA